MTIAYGIRKAEEKDGGMFHCYIPGLLEDNQILMRQDPGYIHRVEAMPEPYRSAYLDGDWEIFLGQMFSFNRQHHVCPPMPIPEHAPIAMSFDWGYGAPYSVGYWWSDADGRVYRCGEMYGWTGEPNKGLRQTDSQIAEEIIKYEKRLGIRSEDGGPKIGEVNLGRPKQHVDYILSPDCFSKKPNYQGGGQGPSTAEVWSEYGISGRPGDPTRDQKVKQMHERLRIRDDQVPMIQIYDTCRQFIRTVPLLQQDENNAEDVDTKQEDHCYDEAALFLMSRPLALEIPPAKMSSYDKRINELKTMPSDSYEDFAAHDYQAEMNRLEGDEWDALDSDEYDDGELISTI